MNLLRPFLISALLILPAIAIQAADDETNRPAPNCALSRLDTAEHYYLQRFKGQVVYVDFWASWCGPCLESFPFMNALDHDLKEKGLQVLAINLDENPDDAKAFLHRSPAQFIVAADTTQAQCAKDFGVKAMPSAFLLDRKGVIREIHYGFRPGEAKAFRTKIEQLLAEPAL